MSRRNGDDASTEAVVRDAARAGDIDRYLAALLAPRAVRGDLIALTAYLGELARIPTIVNEPMMGEIRLQWWRDALDSVRAGDATGSPVADALGRIAERHNLPSELLLEPIDARSRDLDPEHPRQDVTEYLRATEGAAFRLTARLLGVEETPVVADLLAASGQAYGRARLASSPRPVRGGVGAGGPELAQEARVWLAEARRLLPSAPAPLLPAVLPLALVEPYLAALEGAGPAVTGETADISLTTRVWRLWWAKKRRRI